MAAMKSMSARGFEDDAHLQFNVGMSYVFARTYARSPSAGTMDKRPFICIAEHHAFPVQWKRASTVKKVALRE
jgi:hypothetical protein